MKLAFNLLYSELTFRRGYPKETKTARELTLMDVVMIHIYNPHSSPTLLSLHLFYPKNIECLSYNILI